MALAKRVATSESHPIFADFVRLEDLPELSNYRIGMTLCPGKYQPNSMTGLAWDRNLTEDLRVLQEKYQPGALVTLLTAGDLRTLRVQSIREEATRFGMKSLYIPLPDGTAPQEAMMPEWNSAVAEAVDVMKSGQAVVVHCMGGLGRTAAFVCCMLKSVGVKSKDAIELVRRSRKGAGGSARQRLFVEEWIPPAGEV